VTDNISVVKRVADTLLEADVIGHICGPDRTREIVVNPGAGFCYAKRSHMLGLDALRGGEL
jgi:hypothetical protein